MPLTRSFPIDSGFPNAVDLRRLDAGLIAREGVFPDPTTIAAAGIAFGNGAWNVGARVFVAALKRGGAPYSLGYGVARVANDSQATAWTIPAAPVSGSRIDLLWIRATDPSQGEATSGSDGPGGAPRAVPIFGVTSGTPAGSPVAPALPAGALLIATVTTPSGAASIAGSTIVQSYGFAHLVGGVQYFRNAAAREAAATSALPGQLALQVDTGVYYRLTAANTWAELVPALPPVDDSGWITATLGGGLNHETSNPLQYRRLRGVVYFRGRLSSGSISSGTVVFTLPAGFRPDGSAGAANIFYADSNGPTRINIPTNTGAVTLLAASSAGNFTIPFSFIAAV